MGRLRLPFYLLALLTTATYLLSYIYLAIYHGKIQLFNTVIHEGGTYTLLQTVFYSSHFLGHVLVHTAIALFLAGVMASLSRVWQIGFNLKWFGVTIGFLALCIVISIVEFGYVDTIEFILLQRQSVERLERGGSWNLHLPSTLLLYLFIPVYAVLLRYLFDIRTTIGRAGVPYVLASLGLVFVLTIVVNGGLLSPIVNLLTDPRYNAHSVREIATFPLTYFPLVLMLWFRKEQHGFSLQMRYLRLLALLFVLFMLGFTYQVWISLSAGVSDLAQKPSFAHGGKLSIAYLLASHYFEHFLDTIYFLLLSLTILKRKRETESFNNR